VLFPAKLSCAKREDTLAARLIKGRAGRCLASSLESDQQFLTRERKNQTTLIQKFREEKKQDDRNVTLTSRHLPQPYGNSSCHAIGLDS
jgi:hypothetical protein